MNRLKDKVIIVTGAAMGQGAAEAELFAAEGAKVVAGDIATEQLQETVAKINAAYPDSVIGVKLDISCGEDWDEAVKTTVAAYGKVDGLMNNAGLGSKGVPWDKTDYELLKKMVDVNLWGQLRGIQTVVPEMRKVGGGAIVCVSSVAAYVGGFFNAYSLAKGGVRSLGRSAAVTLGKDHIRVNTIVPGTIETPMTSGMFSMPEVVQHCKDQTALGYLGKPEDIAYGALYLLSDEAKFVTGTELVIDGGQRYKTV